MAAHNELGKEGEKLAAVWLMEHGFKLLHLNWRYSHYEIDIVAIKDNTLHFIEVKTRKSDAHGYPEDSVTRQKFRSLKSAAGMYMARNKCPRWIQYDILSIIRPDAGSPQYLLLQDVYL
jgi:putative endonuclease